jgi:hypothetical protein
MRTCLVVIGLLALVPSFTPAQDDTAVLKVTAKFMRDMTDILKPVKDKASAEAALPKLKPIDERLAVLMKKVGDSKLSAEDQKQLVPTLKGFGSEVELVRRLPEVRVLFTKELTLFKEAEEAEVAAAKAQIKVIETAIQYHQTQTRRLPKHLKELTEGGAPAMLPRGIIDPWKKPYQYDAAGPKNKGKKPDVWTVTPDKKVIGNWEEEKK